MDLIGEVFRDLSRSFSLQKPAKRLRTISWSLDKVLDLFKYQSYSGPSCNMEMLLKKTIFLTLLASGGRISEISVLQRGNKFVRSLGPDLLLSPAMDFLVKN